MFGSLRIRNAKFNITGNFLWTHLLFYLRDKWPQLGEMLHIRHWSNLLIQRENYTVIDNEGPQDQSNECLRICLKLSSFQKSRGLDRWRRAEWKLTYSHVGRCSTFSQRLAFSKVVHAQAVHSSAVSKVPSCAHAFCGRTIVECHSDHNMLDDRALELADLMSSVVTSNSTLLRLREANKKISARSDSCFIWPEKYFKFGVDIVIDGPRGSLWRYCSLEYLLSKPRNFLGATWISAVQP